MFFICLLVNHASEIKAELTAMRLRPKLARAPQKPGPRWKRMADELLASADKAGRQHSGLVPKALAFRDKDPHTDPQIKQWLTQYLISHKRERLGLKDDAGRGLTPEEMSEVEGEVKALQNMVGSWQRTLSEKKQ